jgi:hypothetical protein
MNLDESRFDKTMKNIWFDGDADEPLSGDFGRGLGATNAKKRKRKFVLSRTRKMRK